MATAIRRHRVANDFAVQKELDICAAIVQVAHGVQYGSVLTYDELRARLGELFLAIRWVISGFEETEAVVDVEVCNGDVLGAFGSTGDILVVGGNIPFLGLGVVVDDFRLHHKAVRFVDVVSAVVLSVGSREEVL